MVLTTSRNSVCIAALVFACLALPVLCQEESAQDWTSQCEARVTRQAKKDLSSIELVDSTGTQRPNLTLETAWGITYNQCMRTCNPITSSFSFAAFSGSLTNWLLPWIALIAQLPFQTDGPFNDLLSILIAVGSPGLITYSLALTIFNRSRIAEKLRILKEDANNSIVKHVYHRMIIRLDLVRFVLQETQQTPTRAWEGSGWLSSLIILDDNQVWWESVKRSLTHTRRGVTTSLVAQVLFAIVAWLMTIIAAFDELGDPTTALSISSSSIWLWMIPVITGFVAVGTQAEKDTVADALTSSSAPSKRAQNLHPGDPDSETPPAKLGMQDGIRAVSGVLAPSKSYIGRVSALPHDAENPPLNPDVEEQQSQPSSDIASPPGPSNPQNGGITFATTEKLIKNPYFKLSKTPTSLSPTSAVSQSPSILSFDLCGHEADQGPIFNYARAFTAERFSEIIIRGFENALRNIEAGQSPSGRAWVHHHDQNGIRMDTHDNLQGTAQQYHRFCGFDQDPELMEAYPAWGAIPKKVWRHMIVSCIMALFVQWGTTGPSLLIGYTTPSSGVGCKCYFPLCQ